MVGPAGAFREKKIEINLMFYPPIFQNQQNLMLKTQKKHF
jgi:hypothetical protein